jgi:transcriptional regulator with XRE-family HTH domain
MSTAVLYEIPAPAAHDDAALGAIIRAARKRRGLSLRDVAQSMGISHAAVAHWESGLNRPTLMMRIHLARVLNLPFAELVPEAERQVTVTDPQALALLQAFERVPAAQRETLVDIVSGAADTLARKKA